MTPSTSACPTRRRPARTPRTATSSPRPSAGCATSPSRTRPVSERHSVGRPPLPASRSRSPVQRFAVLGDERRSRPTSNVADRALTVGLSTDAAHYAPGADVRLTVTTRDKSGHPVASTVVLRAVDEKLFTLGGAAAADPLGELYAGVESGIRVVYRSHRNLTASPATAGATRLVAATTSGIHSCSRASTPVQDGRASVTMHLSDDLTSWRVSASAIGAGLTAGEGSTLVPVGLPFFVEATVAPEYLVSDRPEIGLRAFGTALRATSRASPSLSTRTASGCTSTASRHTPSRPSGYPCRLSRSAATRSPSRHGPAAGQGRARRSPRLGPSRSSGRASNAPGQLRGGDQRGHPRQGGAGLTEITGRGRGSRSVRAVDHRAGRRNSGRLENALAAAVAGSLAKSRFAAGTRSPPRHSTAARTRPRRRAVAGPVRQQRPRGIGPGGAGRVGSFRRSRV